jgi:hypothetical protein
MSKYYVNKRINPILFHAQRLGYSKGDLCNVLCCTCKTLDSWIANPSEISLKRIILLSGLFGLPVEEFTWLLTHNKANISESGKWFLEDIRERNKEEESI